ncbi:hypothetical protein KDM41_16890, partial [bacterium]|nr:hypothetical protein [bacterium]
FLDQFRTLFGIALLAAPMGTEKDSGYHEAVVDFGPNGAGITAYGAEGWGWTQLIEMQNPVYDATNFLGPLGDAGCVYVSSVAVRTLAWNETSQAFVGDGRVLTYGDFAESFDTLVSAVTDGPTDPVLIVEDRGVDAGRIWLHGRDGARATVVGSAGVSPRKVRAAGGVAVVSSFADDLLTVVLWDGGTSASVAGTVAVGDGPVGIDVMDLGNGTVAVVSTGFNDDTYTVTVLAAADGSVVSKTTHQVPEGGQEPGHAAWVRDGSRRIAISCHGSDEIVVLDSGL